jgi:LmbE family N-acetylglucosaminyl deacetylase
MVCRLYNNALNSPYKIEGMKKLFLITGICFTILCVHAQPAKTYTSAELLQQLKKMNVLGSVLYVAAHPDDENTRLLAYLANEKLYRTGYLSLTRGDGGQNLIGDEQGIDLGLIRTQELLAARRVDGAEQFFSRAYDFGYSKSPEETMRIWGHDEILSDVVWVIRKFRPDVIICRFPTTGEGGHGHHTASAILAEEAFDAAADPTKFPEQLTKGVTTWQATRLMWNTFNFGGNNTQRADQFKMDVGQFNPLLGKSYGEIAAQSRSQHRSQGFGVPAQRGSVLEYFKTLKGKAPVNDLMDGADVSWNRLGNYVNAAAVTKSIDSMVNVYKTEQPGALVQPMLSLLTHLQQAQAVEKNETRYLSQKIEAAKEWIAASLGIFFEAVAQSQLNVKGDSIKLNLTVNTRNTGLVQKVKASAMGINTFFDSIKANVNYVKTITAFIGQTTDATQPYWLENGLQGGRFNVTKQEQIGFPELNTLNAAFEFKIGEVLFSVNRPVQYKFTDPVKGELFQPAQIVNPVFVSASPSLLLFNNNNKNQKKSLNFNLQVNGRLNDSVQLRYYSDEKKMLVFDSLVNFGKGDKKRFEVELSKPLAAANGVNYLRPYLTTKNIKKPQDATLRKISYDHIPDIFYHYEDVVKVISIDLKITGSTVGYIPGAGDKVPEALEQMGYKVTVLKEADITAENLKQFDAVVTGVRAYNTNDWMNNVYDALMQYVKSGGTMLVQYNTSTQIGPVKAKIAPYPFSISRTRITDETAAVNFLLPNHPVLNHPNKITDDDFKGWIQERSIYHADKIDSNYQSILSMADPGEKADNGSLIVSDYGKGRFIYTGLVFFRELPAGVPGAYRLLANLIARRTRYAK